MSFQKKLLFHRIAVELRIYGKLVAVMWHPSNLSIDFITLQELK